jgi:hypothetical protein
MEGHFGGLFFCPKKKVGVPADLVLVSTYKEMRGLEKPPPSD